MNLKDDMKSWAESWIGKLYSTQSLSPFRNYLAYFFDSIWQSSCPRMFCLYFVGGTFAAGKSTLCQTLSGLLPAEHLKASELMGYAPNPKDATGKATDQVQSGFPKLRRSLIAKPRLRPCSLTGIIVCLTKLICARGDMENRISHQRATDGSVCRPHEHSLNGL